MLKTSTVQRICVVEDDARMLELVCMGLREMGHTTLSATDGEDGLKLATSVDFDVIVLDVGLPRLDGFLLAKALRERKTTPIMMLTARDSEGDILRGFEVGADDYLRKPFSFRELLARLDAIARGRQREAGLLEFDLTRMTVSRLGRTITCTRNEFCLLSALYRSVNRVVDRPELTRAVWRDEARVLPNSLEVLVNCLRSKLFTNALGVQILTVRGAGYRLQMQTAATTEGASSHC